jgi:hypothetical protein
MDGVAGGIGAEGSGKGIVGHAEGIGGGVTSLVGVICGDAVVGGLIGTVSLPTNTQLGKNVFVTIFAV